VMVLSTAYDKAAGDEERILHLPGGRQLAYAHNGPQASRIVVIFFSGLMSVGSASDVPRPCRELGVHWITPTLPGMGNSSIRDVTEPYNVALSRDITALLLHLYPDNAFDVIYLAGGSYGSVQAQMLYGAPYELFPPGRRIAGCVLIAGFSPFKYDTNYAKTLNWQNWISIGPLSQIPFHPLQRLFSTVVASKVKSLDGARDFLRQTLLSKMGEDEKATFAHWLENNEKTEFEFLDQMAKGAIKCCKRWDGFMEVADVIHSDWGFEPATLDDEHATKPVLIVGSENDHLGGSNNDWIVANYRSSSLKIVPGGHISSIFYMDEIWQEMINRSRCC
jgi:Alpha/beta hydrolase family